MTQPKVCVIILNWNGWKDTIECLESVFRSCYTDYRVVVCDNNSEDGSLEKIKEWAQGELIVDETPLIVSKFSTPPVHKPISYVEYTKAEAEGGGVKQTDRVLTLIQTGGNLGFAGGNNVGIRYALAHDKFEYIWLLNNDTVVDPNALRYMVQRMQESPQSGICGSTLLYYHQPERIQALGGMYNNWLGTVKHIGASMKISEIIDAKFVERQLDYVVGASMLVTRPFIEQVGLLCEDYFLYFEELDWAMRARARFALVYASKSLVYHKEGASINGNTYSKEKSLTADYYSIRNRIVFTRKHFSSRLPLIYLNLICAIYNRITRRQWKRVWLIIRIMIGGAHDIRR